MATIKASAFRKWEVNYFSDDFLDISISNRDRSYNLQVDLELMVFDTIIIRNRRTSWIDGPTNQNAPRKMAAAMLASAIKQKIVPTEVIL